MKVLIAGIAGALGRMVARLLLQEGHTVLGIDRWVRSFSASANISGVKSPPVTKPTCGASANAVCPVPVATSSTDQSGPGADNATTRASTCGSVCVALIV